MPRIRSIHPRAPHDDDVASMPIPFRYLWDRLGCYADREGRLEDRPLMLKGEVFPADDVNVNEMLDAFTARGFTIRYLGSNGRRLIQIVNFHDYQRPDRKERDSVLPPPEGWTKDKRGKWVCDKTQGDGAVRDVESGNDQGLFPQKSYESGSETCASGSESGDDRPRACSGNPVIRYSGDPEALSARDPTAGTTEGPDAIGWLRAFQIAYVNKFEKPYGRGEPDAKATGRLSDLLASFPVAERKADWERRREIFAEFLGRTDARTQSAGWSFSFFVQDFRALAIPPDKRPKPDPRSRAPDPTRGHFSASSAPPKQTGRIPLP